MAKLAPEPVAGSLGQVAEALLSHYTAAPASQTETAIAVLALWALDAIETGHLSPDDADRAFTLLDVEIGESKDGPDLSEDAHQLLLEGMAFHDWGTEWSADASRVRSLALAILGGTG